MQRNIALAYKKVTLTHVQQAFTRCTQNKKGIQKKSVYIQRIRQIRFFIQTTLSELLQLSAQDVSLCETWKFQVRSYWLPV